MSLRLSKPVLLALFILAAGCAQQDADIRRGNIFFKNKQYDSAFPAYEKAIAKNPKNLELVRQNLKQSYYYYGGSLEMSDSLDSAINYYEKGFDLDPTNAGICDKLAKHFWAKKDFEKAGKYFKTLVKLDAEAPDTDQKWLIMGEDYYALGYSFFETKQYPQAIEAFNQSLKYAPKGKYASQCREALINARAKLKK